MIENRQKTSAPVIGDIYLMKFDGTDSEQRGWRPGVVFQNNIGNAYSPNIIALPLTTAIKKTSQPTHVMVYADDSGLYKDSLVLCENPNTMSKSKLGKFITTLSDDYMKQIAKASVLATSVISYLNEDDLMDVWEQSVSLNRRS